MGILFALIIPVSHSNGGCIKIADDSFVQMSMSPLTLSTNKQASFLFSFGNKEGLINEEINGKIWITKYEEKILSKDFKIKDGILDLKHTFTNPGLYEIFLEFNIGNKSYTPEDFLIEVKEQNKNFALNYIYLIVGILIGMLLMKLIPSLRRQLQ